MASIPDRYAEAGDAPVFICDFSAPRGPDPSQLEPARHLPADFISVAYNPGRYVAAASALAAAWIKEHTGKEVVFTIATRDVNKLAAQSLLVGADLLGLENVVALRGDEFTPRELASVGAVGDCTPSELVAGINALNRGLDYRGFPLGAQTGLSVGATIDLGRPLDREVHLTRRKVEAGAHFFLMQPVFESDAARRFLDRYAELSGGELAVPVFFGVQVLATGGVVFGQVPDAVEAELARGRPGSEIALDILRDLAGAGYRSFYLVPPILAGGGRDYEAAQTVLEGFSRRAN